MKPTKISGDIREKMRAAYLADEAAELRRLVDIAGLSPEDRSAITETAANLVRSVRTTAGPTMMESFLAEYGLSSTEGVALMCLAEALLRVPDDRTIDALISDKIAPANWGKHLGHSSSSLVNASTWGLMLTGRMLTESEENLAGALRYMLRRLGDPVVRQAVKQAMRELGRQFVLGQTIDEAVRRGESYVARGCTYSFDMLGEAAQTEMDARAYLLSYSNAITALASACDKDIRSNPGLSVKLSALHPRYEFAQRERVFDELVPRARSLAILAKSANMGFNIDAEEADRLDLSLDVIEAVLADRALAGWDGFGVVVQAYGQRAAFVLDWLYDLAERLDRRIMVRLVKGAYWDTEIKRAQVLGLSGYPVFTKKTNTDVSYIACARKLLRMRDRIYPQFATHNAHTVAAVLHMADDPASYEFQRLHGMGESLHDTVLLEHGTQCRIYAPVGTHRDLLAYLVRRLLENGANSSFVNQIVDKSISPDRIAGDPFKAVEDASESARNSAIPLPSQIFGGDRKNAKGWDITDCQEISEIEQARADYRVYQWSAGPMIADTVSKTGPVHDVLNPADPLEKVGIVESATHEHVEAAVSAALRNLPTWSTRLSDDRATSLERVAALYERHAYELISLAAREAGKTLADGIAEVREAVDFLRYYANEIRRLDADAPGEAKGLFICISPWNFPLAIFTGQVAAALAAGNAVIAKPAEQTALIAARAVALMYDAGIPRSAVQLLPGDGPVVGGPLVSDPRIAGVCFTGSTETAQIINRALADNGRPDAVLIAETGGLNAMIVDSTALLEQAVGDVIASAFQSAGQRCSALRILYLQKDIEEPFLEMLFGAMDELCVGEPWHLSTDIGPVIDEEALNNINSYCAGFAAEGRMLKGLETPDGGRFVAPTVVRVDGIEEMEREIFGPVLHVARFEANDIEKVIKAVNGKGYGLTFGLHTRVDSRVQQVVEQVHAGNIYVNRNQIGAVVGSQPFGGEGLSGTGPKAGGPCYLEPFRRRKDDNPPAAVAIPSATTIDLESLQCAVAGLDARSWRGRSDRLADLESVVKNMADEGSLARRALNRLAAEQTGVVDLPGPTGESNRLSKHPRGTVICLGQGPELALAQALQAIAAGCAALVIIPDAQGAFDSLLRRDIPISFIDGILAPESLHDLQRIAAVAYCASSEHMKAVRVALAARDGELIPLISEAIAPYRFVHERHLCVDTTAAGGNASLMAEVGSENPDAG